ncbi:MAG: hypothetical protein ABL959_12145 [Pyrinomonadaceae bacterium]
MAKFAIAVALTGFAMSFAITYKSDGLHEGLSVGKQELDDHFAAEHDFGEKIQFSGGMGTYQLFSIKYGWITWMFGVCVLGGILMYFTPHVRESITICGFAGFPIFSILYSLRSLIRDKTIVEAYFWEAPRNVFAKATIAYDWVLVAIAVSFFVLMLTAMIFSWKSSRHAPV